MTTPTMNDIPPVDCDGCTEKPEIAGDVRATKEYQETMNHPDSAGLLNTLADLADLGKKFILPQVK